MCVFKREFVREHSHISWCPERKGRPKPKCHHSAIRGRTGSEVKCQLTLREKCPSEGKRRRRRINKLHYKIGTMVVFIVFITCLLDSSLIMGKPWKGFLCFFFFVCMSVDKIQVTPFDLGTKFFENMIFRTNLDTVSPRFSKFWFLTVLGLFLLFWAFFIYFLSVEKL